jgi:two-component system sensor histidine kinase YesM
MIKRWLQRWGGLKELWLSINGRIRICLYVSVLGMTGIMIYSFAASWTNAYTEVYRFFRVAEEDMSARLDLFLSDYEHIARRTGYSPSIQRYLLSDNPETVIFNYNAAYGFIADAFSSAEGCKNIYLHADTGRYLCANRSYIPEIRKVIEQYNLVSNSRILRAFFVPCPRKGEAPLLLYIFPVYSILSISRSNRALCILVCDIQNSTGILPPEDVTILLFDRTIAASSRDLTSDEMSALGNISPGRSRILVNREWYLTAKVSFPGQPWDFIYMIDERTIIKRVFALLDKGLLASCGVIIVIIVMLIFILRSVNKSISRIVEDLSALEYGTEIRFRSGGPHLREIEKISHSVSLMLERLDSFFRREQQSKQKLIDAVTAQARAEFKSYRSQINPHFLFNTLECMRSMAHNRNGEELEIMISSMSQMFRYSLNAKVVVPLSQELAHVQNFMKVINIRFGNRYQLTIQADDKIRRRPLLSMVLQPLVENAVLHAFNNTGKGDCRILVQALCHEGDLLIRVTDNGDGLSPEELEGLNRRIAAAETDGDGSMGALVNIRRRMRLSYGEGFSMIIRSKRGCYTAVELRLPGEPELILGEAK